MTCAVCNTELDDNTAYIFKKVGLSFCQADRQLYHYYTNKGRDLEWIRNYRKEHPWKPKPKAEPKIRTKSNYTLKCSEFGCYERSNFYTLDHGKPVLYCVEHRPPFAEKLF